MGPRDLPIFGIEAEIVSNLRKTPRLIVTAPTGSGKSTQIPQILLDDGLAPRGEIVVLQPRRLAARMLAARVARERNTPLGGEVGYQIRFENCASAQTRIRYITEGILLAWLQNDPRLQHVAAVLFDEFHERHLFSDVSLARVYALQKTERPDLLLLVMSATLDTAPLEAYLAPCSAIRSEGRAYPVEIRYSENGAARRDADAAPLWEQAAREFERAVAAGARGDALIFMPGSFEIARTLDALASSPAARGWVRLPLHGELPNAQQDVAVATYDTPKVVVATNVAESSLTIEGVRLVIDSGLARVPRFDPHRGINTLHIEKISRASADQRSGRAGRTAPGLCIRLWSEQDHAGRPLHDEPEIKRLDLAEILLFLKASGVNDLSAFPWFEAPPPRFLERADGLLRDLGAFDERTGAITDLGRRMAAFPIHPRYSRMLLAAAEYRCVRAAALIAALTQARPILQRRRGSETQEAREDSLGADMHSDFFLQMRAWRYAERTGFDSAKCERLGIHAGAARQIPPLYRFFLNLAEREGLPIEDEPADDERIQKCVLAAFVDQLACREDRSTLRCRLVHRRRGELARESVVQHSPLIVASEIREIESPRGELNVLLTQTTAVKPEWLRELYPQDFSQSVTVEYDASARRVVAREQTLFRDLVLETKALPEPPADRAAQLLADEALKGRLPLKHWDHAVEQWILRVNALAAWRPELGIRPIEETARRGILEQICAGAASYKDIKDRPVWPALRRALTPQQQQALERDAPERVTLSNGRSAKVTYFTDRPPQISLRIQELYGVNETPMIASGRVSLVVQILAPNHRPVQVTQDLARFWREHYPRVKQELQRKYPKHEWR
jgi:ATP-dependent helicase HrpB